MAKKVSRKGAREGAKIDKIKRDSLRPEFRKVELPNGVRVLTEHHPLSRAVSCGIWIDKGTRDELPGEGGLAHFVEHMVFKHAGRRNAYQISRAMEEVGGDLNAYTSREYTCFVSHALKEHVGLSLDVLSDLVCRPKFSKSDLEKEKQVVLQEIQMSEDMLEDVIFDHYFERVYKGSPLGLPILGTVKSIESQTRASVARFHQRQYRPWNVLVSVAGNLDHDEVLDLVQKHLKFKAPSGESQDISKDGGRDTPKTHAFRDVMKRPSEQAHILIGIPAADFRHRLRFESYIVNTLLGGGMTSRLYQTVREDRGLVYSIYSQLVTYTDDGQCLIYAGADPKKAPTVVELVIKELKRLRKNGIKKSDMEMFKTQVRGQILLGADDVENRINSLGINEMVLGTYRSVDDVMKDVEGVTLDGVHEYIETFIDVDRMAILLMGAIPEGPGRAWLKNL